MFFFLNRKGNHLILKKQRICFDGEGSGGEAEHLRRGDVESLANLSRNLQCRFAAVVDIVADV